MHELLHVCRDILRHGPPMNYDTCPTESNHRPMKALSQNTQRIKSRFEYQTASRLYEANIITTSYEANKTDIAPNLSLTPKQTIKSTNKFVVTYDRNTKQVQFQINLADQSTIENTDLSDISSYIGSHVFDKLTVDNLTCYSAYKRDNLIFYAESMRKRNY